MPMNIRARQNEQAWPELVPRSVLVAIGLLLFLVHSQEAWAEGRSVTATMRSGIVVKGELLAATMSTLFVAKSAGLAEQVLIDHPEYVAACSKEDLDQIVIEGESKVLMGMGYGALIGVSGGAVLGLATGSSSDNKIANDLTEPIAVVVYALLGGVTGMAVGALVGGANSVSGDEAAANTLPDLLRYRFYARFTGEVPPWLKRRVE